MIRPYQTSIGAVVRVTLLALSVHLLFVAAALAQEKKAPAGKKDLKDDIALRRDLVILFNQLGQAFRENDGAKLIEHFDLERIVDQICLDTGLPLLEAKEKQRTVQLMKFQLRNRVGLESTWTRSEIKSIDKLDKENEIVVLVRHFDANTSVTAPMRWWLRKAGKRWRVFDHEDLTTGLRSSDLMGTIAVQVMAGERPEWSKSISFLPRVLNALVRNDLDTAERELQAVKEVEFPKTLEAVRWLLHGNIAIRRQQFQQALGFLKKAEENNRNMIAIIHLRAVCFNRLGQHQQAIKHVQQYVDLLGEDNDTCHELGLAYTGLGRKKEAADAFRRSLQFDSNHLDSLDGLRRVLPDKDKQEIARHLIRVKQFEDFYIVLADLAHEDRDGVGLEVMAGVVLKRQPKSAEVVFDLARAKGMQKKYNEALPLYVQALELQADQARRRDFLRQMLYDMVDGDRALEGYRQAPDQKEAFHILAGDLRFGDKRPLLRKLLRIHRRQHPQDPLLDYHEAELAIDEQRYEQAEKHFAAIDMDKIDEAMRKNIIRSRVFAFLKAGKGMQAYDVIPFKQDVFQQLAASYAGNRDANNLQQLIQRHHKAHPDDPNLPVWEIEVAWLKNDHAAVVKQIHQQRQLLNDPAHGFKMYDRLFLSLYALKRNDTAEEEIRRLIAADTPDDWDQLRALYFLLRRQKETAAMQHFAEACCRVAPKNSEALLLAARGRLAARQLKESLDLFQQACRLQPEKLLREVYHREYLIDVSEAGHFLPAYRAATETPLAFRLLAEETIIKNKIKELAALLKEHGTKFPDDVWLTYYQGELALEQKRYRQAEKLFSAGMEKVEQPFDRNRFVQRLLLARFHLRGAAVAYEKAGPSLMHFTQLANLCSIPPARVADLQKLLAVHRRHFPQDETLPMWEVEVHWLAKDYEKAVVLLRKNEKKILANQATRWKFEDRLVRSLIRLERFDEARKELAAMKRRGLNNLMLEAAVHACAGDVAATAKILEHCSQQHFSIDDFYRDPDLGPALRSDRFDQLRLQYPEPKF